MEDLNSGMDSVVKTLFANWKEQVRGFEDAEVEQLRQSLYPTAPPFLRYYDEFSSTHSN